VEGIHQRLNANCPEPLWTLDPSLITNRRVFPNVSATIQPEESKSIKGGTATKA
jgi:hypothetical protein